MFFKTHGLSDFIEISCTLDSHFKIILRNFMNSTGFLEQRLLFVLFAVPFNVNHTTLQKYCKWILFNQQNAFLTCTDRLPCLTRIVGLIASLTFRRLRRGLCWPAQPYKVRPVFRVAVKWTVSCLTMHVPHEIKWNSKLMQLGNFIDVFLASHV